MNIVISTVLMKNTACFHLGFLISWVYGSLLGRKKSLLWRIEMLSLMKWLEPTFVFLFCGSPGVEEKTVGTASSRSFTLLPVLSIYCSSKWLMHNTENRDGVQSFNFMFVNHFLSLRGLYRGNLQESACNEVETKQGTLETSCKEYKRNIVLWLVGKTTALVKTPSQFC